MVKRGAIFLALQYDDVMASQHLSVHDKEDKPKWLPHRRVWVDGDAVIREGIVLSTIMGCEMGCA